MTGVDFYILPADDLTQLEHYACRLVEKAYRQSVFCYLWCQDQRQVERLDALLWTFRAQSFVPHRIGSPDSATDEVRQCWLATAPPPPGWREALVNLQAETPEDVLQFARILELVDADADRRRQGRSRYKTYQQAGLTPVTHNLTSTNKHG